MPSPAEINRIAVLRANGIGDLMFALPALESLRSAYPDATITLLAAPWHRELLAGRPAPIDEVEVIPVSSGVREEPGRAENPAELASFFARARARRFDLALQMHGGGGYSNLFTSRLGARLTAGLRAPEAPPLDLEVPYDFYQPEVMRYLEVARLVGARPVTFEPVLAVTEGDREESFQILPEQTEPLAVLHPGAGDPRRRWPAEKFAAVADALVDHGATVAVVGGRGEQALARDLARAARRPPIDLAGRLSLSGLAGLLSRCDVLVSNDSGPLHLGGAVGAASVGIYWCGNLITAGPPFRQRHRPQISWRLHCPVCGVDCTRSQCRHEGSFVTDVPVSDVKNAALELLGLGQREPSSRAAPARDEPGGSLARSG